MRIAKKYIYNKKIFLITYYFGPLTLEPITTFVYNNK